MPEFGLTRWLQHTVLTAAQALTRTECKHHTRRARVTDKHKGHTKTRQKTQRGDNIHKIVETNVPLPVRVPAGFTRLEAALDPDGLLSAEAAEVGVIVTNVTLLVFLHNLVSTDGLITDWPERARMQINTHNQKISLISDGHETAEKSCVAYAGHREQDRELLLLRSPELVFSGCQTQRYFVNSVTATNRGSQAVAELVSEGQLDVSGRQELSVVLYCDHACVQGGVPAVTQGGEPQHAAVVSVGEQVGQAEVAPVVLGVQAQQFLRPDEQRGQRIVFIFLRHHLERDETSGSLYIPPSRL
ncbi:hypothetical protein EYF80_014387 [Liparis tanakae]|uniref:Uncharacterized protein n=1 Tax=Liparis tanakae TaxID=230148 RepID=A0A4Z2IBS3_9TELE|nr:hypothetical protein EYF80_014387 [Liparis tanakae]